MSARQLMWNHAWRCTSCGRVSVLRTRLRRLPLIVWCSHCHHPFFADPADARLPVVRPYYTDDARVPA